MGGGTLQEREAAGEAGVVDLLKEFRSRFLIFFSFVGKICPAASFAQSSRDSERV